MKVAVVGLGAIGGAVAAHLADGGVEVLVAQRDLAKAHAFAAAHAGQVSAMAVDRAFDEADVIIPAVWLDALEQLIDEHRAALPGKIIVDPSNPIRSDGKGGFVKTLPQDVSSGETVAGRLPPGARLVKAFGSLSSPSLAQAAHRTPDEAVLFYAADDAEAGDAVAKLIEACGFAPLMVGGLDQSIRIEVFGDLHEFGKLGRLVSLAEAQALLDQAV